MFHPNQGAVVSIPPRYSPRSRNNGWQPQAGPRCHLNTGSSASSGQDRRHRHGRSPRRGVGGDCATTPNNIICSRGAERESGRGRIAHYSEISAGAYASRARRRRGHTGFLLGLSAASAWHARGCTFAARAVDAKEAGDATPEPRCRLALLPDSSGLDRRCHHHGALPPSRLESVGGLPVRGGRARGKRRPLQWCP